MSTLKQNPPRWAPSAVATKYGWANPKTRGVAG